jgi:sialic acid synthase SpsE
MQKSLVLRRNINAGEEISAEDLTCKRPATGLSPIWFDEVVGRKAAKNLEADSVLTLSSIEWE